MKTCQDILSAEEIKVLEWTINRTIDIDFNIYADITSIQTIVKKALNVIDDIIKNTREHLAQGKPVSLSLLEGIKTDKLFLTRCYKTFEKEINADIFAAMDLLKEIDNIK